MVSCRGFCGMSNEAALVAPPGRARPGYDLLRSGGAVCAGVGLSAVQGGEVMPARLGKTRRRMSGATPAGRLAGAELPSSVAPGRSRKGQGSPERGGRFLPPSGRCGLDAVQPGARLIGGAGKSVSSGAVPGGNSFSGLPSGERLLFPVTVGESRTDHVTGATVAGVRVAGTWAMLRAVVPVRAGGRL